MSCIIKRVLQFNEALNFKNIQIFNTNEVDITNNCHFSWSNDMVCWTNWTSFENFLHFSKNFETDFYLRILFADMLGNVVLNDCITTCYSICIYNPNPFLENLCNQNLFNPYANLDCALNLQQQISDSIICMLGIPIYYFRVLPKEDTADYTFKEYVLHNVESVKQLKLMIQDGTMPSSKPQFSDLDFDWEIDWEVELGKTQFATAFGDTAFPKQRDFIYVPMMQRMWEVNSAYDEKNEGLMWRSTTWKLGLIKWNEKTNIDYNDFDDLIDNLVVNTYDNVFAELEEDEQSRESATTQTEMPIHASNSLSNVYLGDAIRKQMTTDTIAIKEKQINNTSVIVAKNIYEFKAQDSLVNYQKGYCGCNGTVSFIINIPNLLEGETTILTIGNIKIRVDNKFIYFGSAKADINKKDQNGNTIKTYMIICKWSKNMFVQEISAYPHITKKGIPAYLIKPEMYEFDFSIIEEKGSCTYDMDNESTKEAQIALSGFPFEITNLKVYNSYLSPKNTIKESLKYTTTNKSCILNDVARPLNEGYGYSPK